MNKQGYSEAKWYFVLLSDKVFAKLHLLQHHLVKCELFLG